MAYADATAVSTASVAGIECATGKISLRAPLSADSACSPSGAGGIVAAMFLAAGPLLAIEAGLRIARQVGHGGAGQANKLGRRDAEQRALLAGAAPQHRLAGRPDVQQGGEGRRVAERGDHAERPAGV